MLMMDAYQAQFGEQPKEYNNSPLEKNDHPEIGMSEELDETGRTIYMSLIGQLQWLVTLGCYDVATAVMTMSRFRDAPRKVHLDRVKRIFGYVRKFQKGCIRVRTAVPDYSSLPSQRYDWMHSVYGQVTELLPTDAPEPLGKPVLTTTYVDANLYHDLLTGRAVTGVLHMMNKTPIDWYSKRQATVETATYSSEFVAARIATDQIIDLRTTLRYLGVPVNGESYMFGDNQSVVTSSTIPHSSLNKRHNALSYHRVREAVAAGIVRFHFKRGKTNPADVLSKHTGHADAWPLVKPMLFWQGNTMDAPPVRGEY